MPDADDAPWFERWPQRVEWEKDQFLRHGFSMREAVGSAGLAFETELTIGPSMVPVRVVYPAQFPQIHPTVYGPAPPTNRHQHPKTLNFCIGSEQGDWRPTDSAADLLVTLVELLTADASGDEALIHASEADMPEPVSAYLAEGSNGAVLVPDPFWAATPTQEGGDLRIGTLRPGGVAVMLSATGVGVADRDALGSLRYEGTEGGRWAASSTRLHGNESNQELANLLWTPTTRPMRRGQHRSRRPGPPKWLGLTFLEEGPERDAERRNWIFLRSTGQPNGYDRYRSQALTRSERQRRLPELTGLSERSVLIVGAGSVGSTIAVELAKAGLAHLTLVDKDAYDVNNSVRHELPLIYAGANKAEAVSFHCRAVNPFSNVVAIPSDAGVGILPPELGKLIAGADLTVDATGSGEITQLLCRTCHEHDRPLLVATLTSSAYGAEVVLGRHEGGCPNCFMLGQGDGVVPTPPSGPASNVTPVGCSQPTFFGAGFEATELAAVATRMAIAGCGGTSYPNLGYDWAVLDFRGDSHWRSGKLERDRQCPYHS